MGPPYPGPWRTKHFPWLPGPLDDKAEEINVMKGAQVAFTEWALNRTFHAVDILKWNVLYALPAATPDAKDFSAQRFDGALSLSPYLDNLFSDTKNIGLKRAGSNAIYIRGSRSKNAFKSIPANMIVLDELEEMAKDNVRLVEERQAGQKKLVQLTLSTPRAHGAGIHEKYMRTDQKQFFFPCPGCNRWITLDWGGGPGSPDCSFVRTGDTLDDPNLINSHYICTKCHKVLPSYDPILDESLKHTWLGQGKWIAAFANRSFSGYWINQLYSSTVKTLRIAQKSILSEYDSIEAQEFHNSSLGVPYEPKDGRINDENINDCILKGSGYDMPATAKSSTVVTMGIDVGFPQCHYEIVEWVQRAGPYRQELAVGKVLEVGTVRSLNDIHSKVYSFRPNYMVIDAQPERRMSLEFAHTYPGRAFTCFYNDSHKGKLITKPKDDEDAAFDSAIISVDRTAWLDLALGRIKNKTLMLPRNIPNDYREHVKALVRLPERMNDGSKVYRYRETGPDHLGHARVYSEVALALSYGVGANVDIK